MSETEAPATAAEREREGWSRPVGAAGLILPALFLAALAAFVWSQRAAIVRAAEAPPGDLALIAVLFAVAHFLNSIEFSLLFGATGTTIGLLENWMLFTAGQLANHLPGQVGTIYRFRYMRTVHGVSYARSAAVYGANLVITFAGAAAAGLMGVIGNAVLAGSPLSVPMLLVFGAMATAAALIALVPLPPARVDRGRIGRLWHEFHDGFERIRALPGTALEVALLETVKYGVTAWRLQITFGLIGIARPFWVFLVLAPAAGVASFIGFTPAALGFRELFVTAAGVAMGLTVTSGLLGATVDRAVMLATFLVLGGLGLLVTWPRLRRAEAAARLAGPGEPRG